MDDNSKNQGWVRLHRKITDHPLWFLEPFTKAQAWLDLFLNANHKTGHINIRGNLVKIERGQIGWSELTMAKRWTWSKNKTRRFLKWLETEQQIVQQKSSITTVITIIKYEDYQQNDTTEGTAERQQKDSRRYTNNNDKNEKNDKKYIPNGIMPVDIYISNFNKLFNREYQVTDGRRRKLSTRLKKFSMDQILQALTALSKSSFHRGQNNRKWSADPDFLIKTDEQVDSWLAKSKPLQVRQTLASLIKD